MHVVLGLTLCVMMVSAATYDGKKKNGYNPVDHGGVGGQYISRGSVGTGQEWNHPPASGLYMYCYPIYGRGAHGTFGIGAANYGPGGGSLGLHAGYGSNKHYGNNKQYKSNKKLGYVGGGGFGR